MKFLKGLALSLLGFLLFMSLSLFGLALMLNSTVLSPDFMTSELERLDISSLVEESINQQMLQGEFPEELKTTIIDTIPKVEPLLKEQVTAATYPVYDYLLGKKQSPDLALTLGDTFLSPVFITSLMNEIDLPLLAEIIISEQMPEQDFPEQLRTTLVNTITKNEALIKEQVSAASAPTFDYLLGKRQNLDLAPTLRNTLLSSELVIALVNELDLSPLASEFISQQLAGKIPIDIEYLSGYLDDVITELEPWIKEQIGIAADPILDYLLGESQSFNISVSLEPAKASLSQYLGPLAAMIPSTFEFNQSLLGTELRTDIGETLTEAEVTLAQARQGISEALTEAEVTLEQGKQIIGYYQLAYKALIGFMLLLILGIILINREVKSAARGLGTTFLTYGVIEYAGIFASKYLAEIQMAQLPPIPSALQDWLPQFINNLLAPLHPFSLGLMVIGAILLIVSFVYKGRQP
ncbi:hypothetical protein ACFLTZ_02010 [Chloroflexota bacterium]